MSFGTAWRRVKSIGRLLPAAKSAATDSTVRCPVPSWKRSRASRWRSNSRTGCPSQPVIHWHGLRIPAAMDGTEVVQRPVQPGETFTYRFTPPDAGTFWYHPHANETEQLEKGLYGALIVRAADELALASAEAI